MYGIRCCVCIRDANAASQGIQPFVRAAPDASHCVVQDEYRLNPAFRSVETSKCSAIRYVVVGTADAFHTDHIASRCRRERLPMLGHAQIRIPAEIKPAPPEPVDLVYLRPLGDFRQYESRLMGAAARFRERIRVTKVRPGELSRFTRERVFVSKTVPTIVLIRHGEVIAEAVGDLPARELEIVLGSAAPPVH
jgi:hypothetical protein